MRVSKVDGSQNVELQRDALKSAPASPRRSSTKMYDREVPSRFILGYAVRMNATIAIMRNRAAETCGRINASAIAKP